MCQINNSQPLITDKDIVVYVIRYIYRDEIYSPFRFYRNTLNKTMVVSEFSKMCNIGLWDIMEYNPENFFHTIETLKEAKIYHKRFFKNRRSYKIYKAIIPVNSIIIYGETSLNDHNNEFTCVRSIATTHLKLIKNARYNNYQEGPTNGM